MKKILLFTFFVVAFLLSCNKKDTPAPTPVPKGFIPIESFYFCSNSTINKTYCVKKSGTLEETMSSIDSDGWTDLYHTVHNDGYGQYGTIEHDIYRVVLKCEKYQKNYVKEHQELKDIFLTSLIYHSLFANYNGKIEEVERVYIVGGKPENFNKEYGPHSSVSVVCIENDSIITRRLDCSIPEELQKKMDGLYILNK